MELQDLKEAVGSNWHQVENYLAQQIDFARAEIQGSKNEEKEAELTDVKSRLETAELEGLELTSQVEQLTAQVAELTQSHAANEALQVQLVTAAKQAASARSWDAIDAIVLQAQDTPSVIRDKMAKKARADALKADADRAIALAEAAQAELQDGV